MTQPAHTQPQAQPHSAGHPGAPAEEALDIRERGGAKNGQPQFSERRLFMQLTAFSGAGASAQDEAGKALESLGLDYVLYEDLNDPRGLAVLTMSENPADFMDKARPVFNGPAFARLEPKPEYAMIGRTYALGYEPNLEDWLLQRSRRVACDLSTPWAVWYPLRRTGAFAKLSRQEQGQILKEHGIIGRRFGDAGFAQDVRLACMGLDRADNDFVIGLVGKELYPLSALVQAMRSTQQTSTYIEKMGPFFVGRAVRASRRAA